MKIDYFKVFCFLVNLLDIRIDVIEMDNETCFYIEVDECVNRLSFDDYNLLAKSLESVGRFV